MKKILLTNNSILIDSTNIKYDLIYTDSPFVAEKYNKAIYLDSLLETNFKLDVENIQKKAFDINNDLVNFFFPEFKGRNLTFINTKVDFTNIYINIAKLFKLIQLHPNFEITIGVTIQELYDHDSPEVLSGIDNRFVNIYYWVADLLKLKNIKLLCLSTKINMKLGISYKNPLFLRLVDLDKKVLLYNLLKYSKLTNLVKKNKIYIYKNSFVIREIEPYLYDLGYKLQFMPEITFNYDRHLSEVANTDINLVLEKYLNKSDSEIALKSVLLIIYKKRISYFIHKKKYTEKYISNLDKSINVILTNIIFDDFDRCIFTQQLKINNFKIINVMHGLTNSFLKRKHLFFYESNSSYNILCFNKSEKEMFKKLSPNSFAYPISVVQEAKNKRLSFIKRFIVNRYLKIDNDINIFYPSINYPYNNGSIFGLRQSDSEIYKFEKEIVLSLSKVNKRAIYKPYPMKSYVDSDTIIEYANSFSNIKVINEKNDFRFLTSIGDIFILSNIGVSSTMTWILGENKPILFLHSKNFNILNDKGLKIINEIFIVIDIDVHNWTEHLIEILNMPYKNLLKIWNDKQIYRDKYDEDWLLGTKLHTGKLASNYINEFILENN